MVRRTRSHSRVERLRRANNQFQLISRMNAVMVAANPKLPIRRPMTGGSTVPTPAGPRYGPISSFGVAQRRADQRYSPTGRAWSTAPAIRLPIAPGTAQRSRGLTRSTSSTGCGILAHRTSAGTATTRDAAQLARDFRPRVFPPEERRQQQRPTSSPTSAGSNTSRYVPECQ